MRLQPKSSAPKSDAALPAGAAPDGTRRRILAAALQCFASTGFHATSVRDLAKQCGLQPGALYVHFPSKEHILAELARLGHEAHHEAIRTELLRAGADPREQLQALVRAHVTMHATYAALAVVVNEELYALPAELAAPALALRRQSSALLIDVVTRGVTEGRFSCRNILVTASAISAMGLRIPYWYEPGGTLTVPTLAKMHAELALRMLGCT